MRTPRHATPSDASVVFRRLADGAALRSLDDAENGTIPDADVVLASLLDLNGTVRVADHLAIRKPRTAIMRAVSGSSPIRAQFAKKVGDIIDEARSAFDDPFAGRRPMPREADMLRILDEEADALATRDPASLLAVARKLSAQARERFEHQLARARQRLRWVRTDIAADVRAISRDAADLESFDAVLTRGLDPGFIRLLQSLERRLDDVFVARFVRAANGLPEGTRDIAPWFEHGGLMRAHAADLSAVLLLVVDHEVDVLHALADAAWALRTEGPSS